jgi:HK97 family phage prohead protease
VKFAGYAALFGTPDAARDTILPGAFAATLAGRREPLPLFWQHRPDQPIGVIETAAEDARGLRIIARIDNPYSQAAALLQTRSVSGLSFGYRASLVRHTPQGRVLEAVDLFEVSLVTHPLQHGARVHFVSPPSTPSER